MFILGLTGSIGMGKSTTAKFFAEAGVPVHDADAVVHWLYDGEAVPTIEAAFPGTTASGKVDRSRLADHLVAHPGDFKKLETIVHPLVAATRDRFLSEAQRRGAPVVVLDIPLLYETGGENLCDAIVVASAPTTVLAHELGHYFGNPHSHVADNVMSYERTGAPVFFDADQGKRIASKARSYVLSGELVPVTP